ncbi:MAG: ABC transporter [Burkholderiales bacterium PBB4]|nr:MAG: ABC transporter [Burkholderiales bacterium PBB4]
MNSPSWGLQAVARILGLLALVLLQACATVANPDRRDPMESLNRKIFGFNDAVDTVLLKPIATVYQGVSPSWVQTGVGNFFNNLEDVWSAVNNALQGRPKHAGESIGRVVVNTTVGLLGVVDVASNLELERHPANFGLTLGRWGVKPGPYVVLPLLGPSTLREVVALPIDLQGNMVTHVQDEEVRTVLTGLNVVSQRAKLLQAGNVVDGAALDKYSFFRDAYLQRQRNKFYDGNPPDEEESEAPPAK